MKKILVAEDDRFIANAYRVKLSKAGYEVKIVSDGEEALSALQEFKPDLLILDLVMPKKDGFTVLQTINKQGSVDYPILVASNLGQKEDIEKAKDLGAVDYIVKSDLAIKDLLAKIQQILGQ